MKRFLPFLAIFSPVMVAGQVLNGGFEQDGAFSLDHWTPSACAEAVSSLDVPAGGGDFSVAIRSSGPEVCNYAVDSNFILQQLPWVTDGMVIHVEWWWKKTILNEYAIAWFGRVSAGEFIDTLSFAGTMNDWAFYQTEFEVDLPSGDIAAIALGGGVNISTTSDSAFFDEVNAYPVVDGVAELNAVPRSRPSPAVDRLWIDLSEAPLFLTAVDASGRTHDLRNFTHRAGTVELDVNNLPPGICLLRITTASGAHTVRFVKA